MICPDCNLYLFTYSICFLDIVEKASYSPIFKYLLKATASKTLFKLLDLVILVNNMSLHKVRRWSKATNNFLQRKDLNFNSR